MNTALFSKISCLHLSKYLERQDDLLKLLCLLYKEGNMIKCHIETVINTAIQHFPCVMFTGPRQVGKSTLLRNVYEGHPYSYVSLDDTLKKNLADSDPCLFLQHHPYPVIIDEARKAPGLFEEIEKMIIDELFSSIGKNWNHPFHTSILRTVYY